MASNSQSDDASDLFWPGYVDAVTNLAINLLFVIAVMSIVVIGITLQISQMSKSKAKDEQDRAEVPATVSAAGQPSAQVHEQLVKAQQLAEQYRKELEQTRKQMLLVQSQLPANTPAEVVEASQNKTSSPKAANIIESLGGPAVVIAFSRDVVTLSASEVQELIGKLRKIQPLASGRWEISVISPRGLSESARLAYYRVNAARNALIENGVSPQLIDMRIHESSHAAADNSKVLLRWLP